uniref:Uncharacterized protein n=1 Tax=Meloidogyne enterolobii TaxID=390850 RepID=A0A6V7VNR6_MELEN|nr:unnamed protein product [Meloidogyne enterolobii]
MRYLMEFSSNIILRQDWNLFFARIWRKVQQQFSYKINTRAHILIFFWAFLSLGIQVLVSNPAKFSVLDSSTKCGF